MDIYSHCLTSKVFNNEFKRRGSTLYSCSKNYLYII